MDDRDQLARDLIGCFPVLDKSDRTDAEATDGPTTQIHQLREAARLMRERAEECGSFRGPWRFDRAEKAWPTVGHLRTADDDPHGLIADLWPSAECGEHIAGWHPTVAMAVSEWLYREAFYAGRRVPVSVEPEALAVARAYMGGDRA